MRLRAALAGLLLATAAPPVSPTQPPRARALIRLVSLKAIAFDAGPELPLLGSPARIDLAANRLFFPQRTVHLWVLHDPPGVPHASLVINGLVCPQIVVRVGSRLEVTLVNQSLRGSATFLIVNHGPPFPVQPVNPDPYKLAFRQHIPGFVAPMTYPPPRARANGFTVYGARLVYDVRSVGAAWYVNNFLGAANVGEYGKILVVP